MVRSSKGRIFGKIWLPKIHKEEYIIYIDGEDKTSHTISAEFSRGIVGAECPCKLTLIDPRGTHALKYVGGEVIELKTKINAGADEVSEWKGTLEKPTKKFSNTYTLELIGSHYQSDLLDRTVTTEYTGSDTADAILKELVDDYLTGYIYVNVNASTVKPVVTWNNKPLHDCIVDLCNLAGFDCYLDSDKDFHFFEKESIENTQEAIIWNQNLIEINDFGADNIDVRNRIIVYGEDESGLPIVYKANDTASQAIYGIKEKVVKDSNIRTYAQAKQLADAYLEDEKDKSESGSVRTQLLTNIHPGDLIWLVSPPQQIENLYRMVKYTYRFPLKQMEIIIAKEKTLPKLFQERKNAELASENLVNPYDLDKTFLFTFDDSSEYDSSASNGITTSEGKLKISGATTGTMVSSTRIEGSNITKAQIKVSGDYLTGVTYYLSADNTNWETTNLEELKTLSYPGTTLRLKVGLTNTATQIDTISVLYL